MPFGPGGTEDPEIVKNPWQVGLFLGGPQLRDSQRTLFPRTAPGVHYVSFGVPASSTDPIRGPTPFASRIRDWRLEDLTRPVAGAGDRAGIEYPLPFAQAVHREGPREGAGYAYRGTIVGEASNPGPANLAPSCWADATGSCDRGHDPGADGLRVDRVDVGGEALAGPMGRSGLSGWEGRTRCSRAPRCFGHL